MYVLCLYPPSLTYRQGPWDSRQFLCDAKQDDEEEDGGEDPQGDGDKQYPAIRSSHYRGACYQRPVEQPKNLNR